MQSLVRIGGVALTTLAVACGDGNPRPPDQSPPAGSITGRERIGWTQPAPNSGELSLYRYAIYVNGGRSMLEGDTCASTAGPAGFECSAPLPALTPGRHTLELAVVVIADGTVIEGPRSAPLQITVGGATLPSAVVRDGPLVASDGLRLTSRILVSDLRHPVDVAAAPDGRVFVAEGDGEVRTVDPGGTASTTQNVLGDLGAGDGAMLVSLALAPDFERSGRLIVACVDRGRDGSVLRLARLREAGGVFGETAVLASYPVPPGTDATIRFGPDGLLYAGISTGLDSGSAQDLPSAAGKILRLDSEGRPADGNPWASAVYSVGHHDPRGLAWPASARRLLAFERNGAGSEVNDIRAGANYGWPLIDSAGQHPFVSAPVLVLPDGTEAAGLTTVMAQESAFFGDLIAASGGAGDLLRLRLDSDDRPRVTAHLLQGRFGPVAQVAAGADGAIYFVTGRRNPGRTPVHADIAAEQLLVRLTPTGTAVRRRAF